MVTNIPQKAKAQWDRVSAARFPREKLRELEIFKSMVPRHKGTDKLLMQVKRKMALLRSEISEGKRSKTATYVSKWTQPKHGAAKIALVGSSPQQLVAAFHHLTDRQKWPRELFEPHYGILEGGRVQFQIVLLPPLTKSPSIDEKTFNLCRNSDLILFLDTDAPEEFHQLAQDHGILPTIPGGTVEIERTSAGGVRIVGRTADATQLDVIRLLEEYRIRNAVVKMAGEVKLGDVENAILETWRHVPCFPLRRVNGTLVVGSGERNHPLTDRDSLASFLLDRLSLMRVYTKVPGQQPAEKPILMKKRSHVGDLTREIHSYLAKNFKYALVWRNKAETPLRVSKSYELRDGDVVEIRAR